jgi:hypothetical protein
MAAAMNDTKLGRIAYLFGSDAQPGIVHRGGRAVVSEGNTDIWRLRSNADDFLRLHIPPNFGRISIKPTLEEVGLILNLVTDPDRNPKVLGIAERFLRRFPGRILNPPRAVLGTSRDRVARLLAGIDGLVVPPTVLFKGRPNPAMAAIERAGLHFPAILRRPGTHNGQIIHLVRTAGELLPLLDPVRDYLLTEYVDIRDGDGLCHKIRVYWFGQTPVVRHMLASDDWNVHAKARETTMVHHPAWIERERALLAAGLAGLPDRARTAIEGIRARMPLDYFGIDFALLPDDRVLLFEANATMNFFPLSTDPRFAYAGEPVVATGRAAIDRMIAEAME